MSCRRLTLLLLLLLWPRVLLVWLLLLHVGLCWRLGHLAVGLVVMLRPRPAWPACMEGELIGGRLVDGRCRVASWRVALFVSWL